MMKKQNNKFVSFYDYKKSNSLRYKLMNENIKYNYEYTSYKNEMIQLYEEYINRYFLNTSIFNPYDNYIDSLNEGLIMSYNYDIFAEYLEKYSGITVLDINYVDNNDADTKMLYFITYEDEYNKYKDKLKTYINKCGYFISLLNKYTYQGLKLVDIQVEPKFIVEVTSGIYDKYDLIYDKENDGIKNKCNGILYHITLDAKYNKIKDNGLIPKSGNKKSIHPERIYFYPSNLIDKPDISLISQAKFLYKPNGKYINSVMKYVTKKGLKIDILKIDLYKYQNIKYRFFQDPNHPQGIFTYEPVHPECVELYKSFYV